MAYGTVLIASLGDLEPGKSATMTVVVSPRAAAAGPVVNKATVSSASVDPNSTNDSATVTTTVLAASDLSITMDADDTEVPILGDATFHLVVSNNGPSSASRVRISVPLGTDAGFVSAVTSQGTATYADAH